jgi:hypothetical protein
MAAMRELDKKELSRLLPWLLSWSIRGIIVGGIGKGKYEVNYAKAALAISERKTLSVKQILDELDTIVPTDTEFEIAFRTYRVPNANMAHYLLRALESGKKNESEPYVIVNPDHQQLTLEHILPKSPIKEEWPKFETDEIIEEYLPRLGNLALVTRKKNSIVGNKPFKEKIATYAEAPLELTKEIANEVEWTPDEIEKRQKILAKLAIKVWPRIPPYK